MDCVEVKGFHWEMLSGCHRGTEKGTCNRETLGVKENVLSIEGRKEAKKKEKKPEGR